jgi:kinesin family member 18/19
MAARKSFIGSLRSTGTATSTTPGKSQASTAAPPAKPQVIAAPLMSVAVRVRPLSQKELQIGHRPVVVAESDAKASIAKLERMGAVLQSEKGQMHSYEFDRVFSESATNRDVYEATAKNLVPKVLDGMNCTIFAYGATGAGRWMVFIGSGTALTFLMYR